MARMTLGGEILPLVAIIGGSEAQKAWAVCVCTHTPCTLDTISYLDLGACMYNTKFSVHVRIHPGAFRVSVLPTMISIFNFRSLATVEYMYWPI